MAKNKAEYVAPEWSHLVNADEIDESVSAFEISPDEEEAQALTRRLDVKALENVTAKLNLQRQGQVIYVQGRAQAKIIQSCVVSLDPVETQLEEEFEAWFADPEQAVSISKARRERELKKGNSEVPMLEESDDPEPIIEGQIDLGELVVQYLSLGINPYPHAEGVEYQNPELDEQGEPSEHRKNPFAALKDWKDNLK